MAVHFNSFDDENHKKEDEDRVGKSKVEVEEVEEEEDDYIDMEVSTFSAATHFFSALPTEFEFQMSSLSGGDRENSTTSPADELFYKGKLLPLHLPPRLQMVEKLLQDSPKLQKMNILSETYSTPLGTTPFESCNISPSESCQVSRELNPEEYFRHFVSPDEYSSKGFINDNSNNNNNNPKKSWTKKLKTKIKAIFGKSTDDSKTTKAHQGLSLKVSEYLDKEIKGTQKFPFEKEAKVCHRRSFSGAFKRRSSTIISSSTSTKLSSTTSSSSSSLSSSSSSNSMNDSRNNINSSNGAVWQENQALKRSSSASSERESSLIQGAIAHCKKSQQVLRTRKTLSEIGFHSFSSSRFATNFDDQTRATGLCRG